MPSLLTTLLRRIVRSLRLLQDALRARYSRRADDGRDVFLVENTVGDWYVGRIQAPSLDPYPMGEFASAEAARHYADQRFPGGTWQRAPRGSVYP